MLSHYHPYEWSKGHENGEEVQLEAEYFYNIGILWHVVSTLSGQGWFSLLQTHAYPDELNINMLALNV